MSEEELVKTFSEIFRKVYMELGPGLYESVYELAILKELKDIGIECENQVVIQYIYKDIQMKKIFRADILAKVIIEGLILLPNQQLNREFINVIIEIKAREKNILLNIQQLQTYLKLTNTKYGFLVNFNVTDIEDGYIFLKN